MIQIIANMLAKIFSRRKTAELERIEELAKQERREEGAFPPDHVQ